MSGSPLLRRLNITSRFPLAILCGWERRRRFFRMLRDIEKFTEMNSCIRWIFDEAP